MEGGVICRKRVVSIGSAFKREEGEGVERGREKEGEREKGGGRR